MNYLRILAISLISVLTIGCGKKEKKYKDDPKLAAEIKARKAAEKAEPKPEPYIKREIKETVGGTVFFARRAGNAVWISSLALPGDTIKRYSISSAPDVSPDGKKVLGAYFDNHSNRFEICLIDAGKGKNPNEGNPKLGDFVQLTNNQQHDSLAPAWSPDGSQILHVQRDNNVGNIALMNADGSNARVIVAHEKDEGFPCWSPDGKQIAFSGYRGSGAGIYLANADGSGVKRLTSGKGNATEPAWSPDGKTLAYVVSHKLDGKWVRDLRVIKLDGTGERTLIAGKPQMNGPCWSPGGDWLAVSCDDAGTNDISIVDFNGEGYRKITNDKELDSHPCWVR